MRARRGGKTLVRKCSWKTRDQRQKRALRQGSSRSPNAGAVVPRAVHTSGVDGGNGQHSPDRAWWWTGTEWRPAWSVDRRWWFDGQRWVRVRRHRPELGSAGRRLLALWSSWGVALVVWSALNVGLGPSRMSLALGGALLFIAGVGLLSSGVLLGRVHRRVLALPLVGYVTIWLLLAYVMAMLLSPVNPADVRDLAAGVGVLFLAVPSLCSVGVLAGFGLLIEYLHRRLRADPSPP